MYAHGFQDLDGHIWELLYIVRTSSLGSCETSSCGAATATHRPATTSACAAIWKFYAACRNAFWDRERQAHLDTNWQLFTSVFYFRSANDPQGDAGGHSAAAPGAVALKTRTAR
jgi:hypothetical protein